MARIDAGTVQPQRSWTTPAEVVEAAMSHVAPVLAGRDVRVDARDDEAVEIDPRLVASGLAHLLENAAPLRARTDRSTFAVGPTIRRPAPRRPRPRARACEPQEIERLFEPFYRGEVVSQPMPGTGMGLAITRGLVAADGGRVWAENLAPEARCFSIAVPEPDARDCTD